MASQSKLAIYWDVDDVVLNTSETVIQLINDNYNRPNSKPMKEFEDLKDWKMKSINRDIESGYIWEVLESNEFWDRVNFNEKFIKFISSPIAQNFRHYFLTVGTLPNLQKKHNQLCEILHNTLDLEKDYNFIGLPPHTDKHIIDMEGGIQIDDNLKNLVYTNAEIKILLKNNLETDYNIYSKFRKDSIRNLYETNTLEETFQILEFILDNPGILI